MNRRRRRRAEPLAPIVFEARWRSSGGLWLIGSVLGTLLFLGCAALLAADGQAGGAVLLSLPGWLSAWLAWLYLTIFFSGRPLLRLDPQGVGSPRLPGGFVPWHDVLRLEWLLVHRGHGVAVVHVHRPLTGGLTALLPQRLRLRYGVPLHALPRRQQWRVADALDQAMRHWAPASAQAAETARAVGQQASIERGRAETRFERQLDRAAPTAWAWRLVFGLCLGLWLMQVLFGVSPWSPSAITLLRWGGNTALAVEAGQGWRLLTAMFLHAGVLHLALNLYALWAAGVLLTRWLGNAGFLLVYVGAGLLASAASLHFAAHTSVSVGASGAIFGLAGALFAVWLRHHRRYALGANAHVLVSLFILVAETLRHGLLRPGIDNAAHLGGLLAGLVLGLCVPPLFAAPRGSVVRWLTLGCTAVASLIMTIAIVRLVPPVALAG